MILSLYVSADYVFEFCAHKAADADDKFGGVAAVKTYCEQYCGVGKAVLIMELTNNAAMPYGGTRCSLEWASTRARATSSTAADQYVLANKFDGSSPLKCDRKTRRAK